MIEKKIVIAATDGDSTRALYHCLCKEFFIYKVIIEKPIAKKVLVKNRIKKLGIMKVVGQLMFQVGIYPIIKKLSETRIKEIIEENNLDLSAIPLQKTIFVNSINNDETKNILRELRPDIVIVNGTRIISKSTLSVVNCPWINTHAGITPKYRGVHGGYWALVNNDQALCGVTIHFVDKGIDTGQIIEQKLIKVGEKDNFATYPYLQMATGFKNLNLSLKNILLGNNVSYTPLTEESRLWHHPTIWTYFCNYLIRKVK